MKPYLLSLTSSFLFLSYLGTASCTSTETGNPVKDGPGGGSPVEGTPIQLHVGLRGSLMGMEVPAPGPNGELTALWLQVAEIDFVTCQGQSLSTSGLLTEENLTASQPLTVTTPNEEVCAIVVRTEPLSPATDNAIPPAAAGQGAVVEGTDTNGVPFSALVPQRITSVLTPLMPGLTLAQATSLHLQIEDSLLLDAVSQYQVAVVNNVYDAQSAPEVVNNLAEQLNVAFSLENGEGATRQVLATSSVTWMEVDDLLCASECALQQRTSCSDTSCDVDTCVAQLMDPACGDSFRSTLHCRVGLNPNEYACTNGEPSVNTTDCAPLDSTYGSCGG